MSASVKAASMSSTISNLPPLPAAFDLAASMVRPISLYPGGCASDTFMPKRVINVISPCGTLSGLAYDGANAQLTAMILLLQVCCRIEQQSKLGIAQVLRLDVIFAFKRNHSLLTFQPTLICHRDHRAHRGNQWCSTL